MFVLTIDQKDSRIDEDRIPWLLDQLYDLPTIAAFQRAAGDEVQGVPATAQAVVAAIVILMRDERWHCGLGIGEGHFVSESAPTSAEGTGQAFFDARKAVEESKQHKEPLVICSPLSEHLLVAVAHTLLRTLRMIYQGRTQRQKEIIAAYENLGTMDRVAEAENISTSAVSQSLSASRYHFEQEIKGRLELLLEAISHEVSA